MTQQQEVLALFYLCYCKLNHISPDQQRTKGLDISQLYQISVYHDIGAIVCMALESAGILDHADPQTAKAFRNIRNKSLRKVLLLDNGRAEIFRFLDENKIWHMPLKGVILKDYYPELGMRQMSDNDILYDAAFRKTMQQYMLSQGYTLGAKKAYEDDYFKLPVYNYEMHLSLFGNNDSDFSQYFQNIEERLIRNGYLCCFTDEDFYLYFMAHAAKHYRSGGTGLRHLLDCYVFLSKKRDNMDWNYLHCELEKLGLVDFERDSRLLAEKVLTDQPVTLTEPESKMLDFLTRSGTYGTLGTYAQNEFQKTMQKVQQNDAHPSKLKYVWHRLFPDDDFYQNYSMFCYRHKWARPFYTVYRLARLCLTKSRRKKVRLEAKLLQKK